MNGKEVLDRAVSVIARTDVDRLLLLFFMNNSIRELLRDKSMKRFVDNKTFSVSSGIVAIPTMKNVFGVFVSDGASKRKLAKMQSLDTASDEFNDITATGIPRCYLLNEAGLRIIPAPDDSASIHVVGEFWPTDITDSTSSTNLFSNEIPMALAYLGTAEYLDFLQEEKRGEYWRGKAILIIDSFIKGLRVQEMTALHNYPKDPLGNLGFNRRTKESFSASLGESDEEIIDDYGVG